MTEPHRMSYEDEASTDLVAKDQVWMVLVAVVPLLAAVVWHVLQGS